MPLKYLTLASALALTACGNATDMPVAAPGEDIVASDPEGMADAPVILASDLSRKMFAETPDVIPGLAYGQDSDEFPTAMGAVFREASDQGATTRVQMIDAADGRRIHLVTQTDLRDDSIASRQIYAEFLPTSPFSNSLEYLGTRQICARGANTTDWTTDPCP